MAESEKELSAARRLAVHFRIWGRRSWDDTWQALGARMRLAIVTSVCGVVIACIIPYYAGKPEDMSIALYSGLVAVATLLATLAATFLLYLFANFLATPSRMYWEDQKKIAELEQPNRQPDIVFDHYDEAPVKHGDGQSYKYTYLWFRNRPTGRSAYDVAARVAVWRGDGAIRKLFSFEGKWMGVAHDQGRGIHQINTMNLLPNDASHGLDLFIRPPGAPDCYAFTADSTYRGFQRDEYRVPPSYYYVRVMLSCEGYTQDFRFSVRNNEQNQSLEVEQVAAADDVFFLE